MKIHTEKLSALVRDLVKDINKGYSKCEVSIAQIDGVVVTISAYHWREANDCDIDEPIAEHVCMEAEKGGA